MSKPYVKYFGTLAECESWLIRSGYRICNPNKSSSYASYIKNESEDTQKVALVDPNPKGYKMQISTKTT